ncbi:MAG: 6-carboxytetrahydropterin synthase [Myxococcota bacterium]|nr:6-carboxytetrahydropterin synthase [Myxococcota bacterium]MEC9442918.1 6-carboxytetrahydropterin synthase [Myxococcota bacterium]
MYRITLEHNFETAHRLSSPGAPIKCQSIHGHSWWVKATIAGEQLDEMGMLVEFGAFKKAWRAFLDDQVDHHLLVKEGDPVGEAILGAQPDARLRFLEFDPTTEHLARWLFEQTSQILSQVSPREDLYVVGVHLQETRVNAAEYISATSMIPSMTSK